MHMVNPEPKTQSNRVTLLTRYSGTQNSEPKASIFSESARNVRPCQTLRFV
jgi:hypothetical protein